MWMSSVIYDVHNDPGPRGVHSEGQRERQRLHGRSYQEE
jgi:hypothetical protein